jgi:hypothetical protein
MHGKTDSEVEQYVLRELNDQADSREVCVLARAGVVTLRGSAQSYEDKFALQEAALRATGVVCVVNEMRVKPSTALIKTVSASVPLPEAFRLGLLVQQHSATPHSVTKAATP